MNGKTRTRTVASAGVAATVLALGSLSGCSGALDDASALDDDRPPHRLSLATGEAPAPG